MDNYLLIGIGIFAFICVLVGYIRGAIKLAVSLVSTVAVIVIVMVATPKVSDALMNHTPIGNIVAEKLDGLVSGDSTTEGVENDSIRAALKNLSQKQLQALGIEDVDNLSDEEIEEAKEKAGIDEKEVDHAASNLTRQDQIELINDTNMPSFLKQGLLTNNNTEIYDQLGVNNFVDYVKHYVAKWVITIVAFLITFMVAFILVRIVIFSLDALSELPVIHGFNRMAGGVLGLVFAVIFIWILFMVLTLLYTTAIGKQCFAYINDSKLLTFLYDNNILLKMII